MWKRNLKKDWNIKKKIGIYIQWEIRLINIKTDKNIKRIAAKIYLGVKIEIRNKIVETYTIANLNLKAKMARINSRSNRKINIKEA
jgi:hypothetical protein